MSCQANGSAVALFYVEETADGNIPESPEWKPIRFVTNGFTRDTAQIDSDEIRPDRQRPVSRQGTSSIQGDIACELTYGSFDDLLEAGLQGAWGASASLSADTISADAATDTFSDSGSGFEALGLSPGDKIVVSGFTEAGNNGTFTVFTVTAGAIAVAEALTTEIAGDSVTISTAAGTLKVGQTRRSFAILERHTDKDLDYLYRGCEVNTIGLTLPLGEKVTVNFGMIGRSAEPLAALPAGSTFATRLSTDVMVTTEGSLSEGGAAIGYATALDVTLDNGMQPTFVLFSRSAYCISNGRCAVSGNLSTYLVDGTLYDKYLDEDVSDLVVQTQADGNAYRFSLPRIRYTQGNKPVSGPDAIVKQLTVSAGYDAASDTTISIERVPA